MWVKLLTDFAVFNMPVHIVMPSI